MEAFHLNEPVEDRVVLNNEDVYREGFVFSSALNESAFIFDALVIRCPEQCRCFSPQYGASQRSLQEHIDLVNELQLEKAVVIGEDISFLSQCPTLQHLWIHPADSAADHFDFSPLYQMPQVLELGCSTVYGGIRENKKGTVDCSQIPGLRSLYVRGKGMEHFEGLTTLERLSMRERKEFVDLRPFENNVHMKQLEFSQCGFTSLNGLEHFPELKTMELFSCRRLADISALAAVGESLEVLRIESCAKIEDFEALGKLKNLKLLVLRGSNTLPNLNFLKCMTSLQRFVFEVDVADGDLTPCLHIPEVVCMRNRRHFNRTNDQLPHAK